MQLTSPLYQIRLTRYVAGAAWKDLVPSKPSRPSPGDAPTGAAIPTGLAFQARDGLAYTVRRVTLADEQLLGEFVRRLSDDTRWLRYMTARPCSPEFVRGEVARMVAGSAGDSITLVVAEMGAVVAVAELVCDRERAIGEVAVVVMDDAQRTGIGGMLLRQLLQIAQELGLAELHGDMLAENYAMQQLVYGLRIPYTATIQAGQMHIIVPVPQ